MPRNLSALRVDFPQPGRESRKNIYSGAAGMSRETRRRAKVTYLRSSLAETLLDYHDPSEFSTLRLESRGLAVTLAERKEKTHRWCREIKRQISIMCARAPLAPPRPAANYGPTLAAMQLF
jgi:hypothetical protein